jgi:hypothetical protein
MMATNNAINPPNTPIVANLTISREWWRFFNSLNQTANAATEGSVTTDPGSGLSGGGQVSGGISIRIANNGVTNGMIRQSAGTSVIGRAFGSAGNVADITADANNRVLSREGSQLAFRSFINGVSIGPSTAAPLVRADAFETTQTPTASAATTTHRIPIETDSGTMWILLSNVP